MSFNKRINIIIPPLFKRGLGGLINLHIVNPPVPLLQGGKFLLIFVLLIGSCSAPYKKLPRTELDVSESKNIPYALPYSSKALIFKADINFYKNNVSGLLIIKKIDENIYRIALTTQFGLKIFDFELNHGDLKVEYCAEYLSKKVILNTLQNDFNLLLMQNKIESIYNYKLEDQNKSVWQLNSGNLNYSYIQDTDSQKIVNMSFRKQNSEKISVRLHAYKGDIPGEINLEHHNIKLNMNLKLIQ
ncbi:MAG: hypothetical protein C0597_16770 [Marinilabiliales bacterium]|nr:MAG: hypothetical protein C0597_16770 [Marinilabiliales bacterium]